MATRAASPTLRSNADASGGVRIETGTQRAGAFFAARGAARASLPRTGRRHARARIPEAFLRGMVEKEQTYHDLPGPGFSPGRR
jgi:hypothetical protein